jgi:hypothetical protein
MTEIKQHRDVPPGTRVQRNSGHIRTTPAGGEVDRSQYYQPSPPVRTVADTQMDPAMPNERQGTRRRP